MSPATFQVQHLPLAYIMTAMAWTVTAGLLALPQRSPSGNDRSPQPRSKPVSGTLKLPAAPFAFKQAFDRVQAEDPRRPNSLQCRRSGMVAATVLPRATGKVHRRTVTPAWLKVQHFVRCWNRFVLRLVWSIGSSTGAVLMSHADQLINSYRIGYGREGQCC